MKRLFGTDGMRGEAGRFPLDAQTITTAGRSLARHLSATHRRQPHIVIGRDTRESGAWIERAFLDGAREAGAACISAGIITTPGIAYLARTLPADAGIVVSASHNPFHDNGIKIFAQTGRKLDDATERLIEADIHAAVSTEVSEKLTSGAAAKGSLQDVESATLSIETSAAALGDGEKASELQERYLNFLVEETAAGLRLDGLRMVVDCANGAASRLAPALFERLGAQVVALNNAPDGRNINRDSGSLHVENLGHKVIEEGARFGVAFDGDADRALFIDARGEVVDGDATLWVLAQYMASRGELSGDTVVATVMSNIGLETALRTSGIRLLRADVGDKYVLEELLRTGASLGGEQSGHIIFPRVSLAGDGMMTTLFVLRALADTQRELHELTEGFVRYPQVLLNVRVREKLPFQEVEEIERAARKVETELGTEGRLLLRYSGTEPLARVMIEGRSQEEILQLAKNLATVIERQLGAR